MRAPSRASSSSSRCATASASTPKASGSSSSSSRRGRPSARSSRTCEQYFVEQGCGRLTMDMVLTGAERRRAARVQDRRRLPDQGDATWCCRRSRSPAPAATGSRSRARSARASRATRRQQMLEAYEEYYEAARRRAPGRRDRARRPSRRLEGLPRPRLQARPRHRPLDRDDDDRVAEDRRGRRDGAAREGMVFSMHPHAISQDGQACLYMQDTWLVTADGGVPLADLPMKIFDGTEARTMSELAKPILPGDGGSDYERYLRTDELLALQKTRRRVDPPRRAALPVGAPDVRDLAQARVERDRGGGAARRGRTTSPAATAPAAPRERLLQARHVGARHARAHVAVGVHRGAQGARPRQRLRLARLQGAAARREAARRGVPRGARARRAVAGRGLHARPRVRGPVPRSPSS